MYNKHTIRDIKEEFDWESYLDFNYSTRMVNGKNGTEIRICCPNCGESKYKCYVNPSRSAFYCFKCPFRTGSKYDLFDFVALTESITRGQALLRLLGEYKHCAPEDSREAPFGEVEQNKSLWGDSTKSSWPDLREIDGLPGNAYKLEPEEDNPYWKYLQGRGFQEEDLSICNVHYVPSRFVPVYDSTGKFKGNLGKRIVFPVYGPDGKLVGWQARRGTAKVSSSPKFLNAPETDISKTLWPFSTPFTSRVTLVEGIIDALAIRRVEKEAAYATFGKKISREQIQILKKWGVTEVILWYDKSDAGKDMEQAIETLKMNFKEVYVVDFSNWPDDKDTGDFLENPGIIQETLNKKINVYSLEYERWKLSF
jgi:DNA primase